MGALLIFLAVVSAFLGWPVNRWVSRGGGSIPVFAFSANATVAALSVLFILLTREPAASRAALAYGALGGIALVAGYWTVVMWCLRIGPASPTVALYNMSLVWPVVAGACWLAPRPFHAPAAVGVVLVLAALAVSLTGPPSMGTETESRASRRWLMLSLLGWLLGGCTMVLLMAAQMASPLSTGHVCLAYATIATLLLAPGLLRRPRSAIRAREVGGGAVAGALLFVNSVTVLASLRYLGPQVVYTLPTVIPIVLMLVTGHLVYRERLTPRGWATCLLGACAVLALAAGGA